MKKWKFPLISLMLTLALVLSAFAGLAVTASADEGSPLNEFGLVDKVEGGSILHCWCWSFNSIKEKMKTISDSGYSAVQTSPINEVYVGDNGGMQLYGDGKWYYSYQPTSYKIGNYMLGTEDEFKDMCAEAHKYGVKVIVDVVANHTTPTKSAVASELKNIEGGLYHNDSGNSDDERRNMTQWYNGLPDVNTQNPKYQQLVLDFLKRAVADGADGFRYDTGKHIELPDDDPSYASRFWPTVLENGSTFQYGEVLQGVNTSEKKASRLKSYSEIMHVTASGYGGSIRDYFLTGSGSATTLKNYNAEGAANNSLVTWVESHDTYANGETPNNIVSSYWLTNDQIRIGWAMIAARSDTTTLFFSRPYGSEATDQKSRYDSPIWGTNHIGDAGDDNYCHPEVVAVNKFRNAMIGESETLANAGSKKYFMVTRGTRGVVITNNSDDDLELNRATTIAQGTYTDASYGGKFVVKNGTITGTVKAHQIAVLYDDPELYTTEVPEDPPTEPTTEAPHEHRWGSWTVSEKATVDSDGVEKRVCLDDPEHFETRAIPKIKSISYNKSKFTYNGKNQKPSVTVKDRTGKVLVNGTDYKLVYPSSPKNAGLYVMSVEFKGSYAGVDDYQFNIVTAKNPMTVTAKKTVTANSKKKTTIKSAVTVKKAQGKVTYKTNNKKVTVSSGKMIVQKGLKKGKTYTVKVTVTAKGNKNYKKLSKTVSVKVKVK